MFGFEVQGWFQGKGKETSTFNGMHTEIPISGGLGVCYQDSFSLGPQ